MNLLQSVRGTYLAPAPAVALELRHNLNYDGDRDGTCSRTSWIRFRCRSVHPRRIAFWIRTLACAVMASIARWAMATASRSNSRGPTWISGLVQSRGWDGSSSKQPNVHRSRRWRPGASTSFWIRGCGRAFGPLPADSKKTGSVAASGSTAGPLLLWCRAEDVRAEVVAGDASGLLNRQHIFSRHPLPLANSLRGHTAHPSDMGGTTKRFEGDVLHG